MVAAIEPGGRPTQAEFHDAISSRSDRWFSACLRITRNPALAEDAVQEALELFRESRNDAEKRELLETLVNMDSDAVWEIIDSTLENEQ